MPIIHNNILSVTVDELVSCGVKETSLWELLKRQRQGLVYCWEHHKDGRKVYIHYDSLRDTYKNLITQIICGGVEPRLWLENQEAEKLQRELDRLCGNLNNMVEIDFREVENLTKSGLYTPQEVQQIARAAGWLRLWRKMDVKTARKHGFDSVKEVQNEMFKRCLNEQQQYFVRFPKPINTFRVLEYKAREYAKEGLNSLIAGYFGNANRELIDTKAHAILMELASNPCKYSFEDMGLFYNTTANDNGVPRMTVSAIKQHLNTPKHKRIWMFGRHGKHDAAMLTTPQIERDPVSRADALWSLDGSTMQMYYRDENGKIKSDLYVYFITDVYSSAIIGYSVAFSETSGMVVDALKMAVDKYGYKPFQLQYDNGSANVSDAIQGVMSNMSRVHFGCRPYWGQSKYIETYIGHFQQRVLRKDEAFKGGNVTSPSLNSKANPDLLKKFKENPEQLYTESEVLARFAAAVNEWNARGEKRNEYGEFVGEAKIERYMHPHADREKLTYFEKISLFMSPLAKPYPYGLQGITITLGGKKRKYIVPDMDGIGDFEFNRLHLNEKFNVRINVLNPDFITLYKDGKLIATGHEKDKYAACVADMKNKPLDASKIKLFLQKQEQYGYDHAISEMEKQRAVLAQHGLKATGTDGFGFGWADMSKSDFNDRQSVEEDIRNGIVSDVDIDPIKVALNSL